MVLAVSRWRWARIMLVSFIVASVFLLVAVRPKAHASGGYPWSGAVCVATGQVSGKCPNYEWSHAGSARNPSTGNYYYRNCTDYAAWKLMSQGVSLSKVSGLGNAGSWDNNAPAKGLSVSSSPSIGSIGVDERYGHVVFVESVNGSTITISEYNWGSAGSYGTRSGTPRQLGLSSFINFELSTPIQTSSSHPVGVWQAQFLGRDRLYPNQAMSANQYIESPNTKHVLLMQPDGNLVHYGDGFRPLWHTHTYGNPGAYAIFQGDGNLVIYASSGRPLWASGMRYGAASLVLQTDGNLVTYNSAWRPLWHSGVILPDYSVFAGSDHIRPNQALFRNYYIRSSDGRYSLIMQADGNLVLYAPGYRPLWHSHTYGNPGAYLAVQGDGNLVVYSASNRPLWWSGTKANPSHLIMQSDGNLVQYNIFAQALWHTRTHGQI